MSQSIDSYTIVASTVKNAKTRIKEITFGGGYRQFITDGLNANEESWSVEFKPVVSGTASSLETVLLNSTTSEANLIAWTPPGATTSSYFTAHDIQKSHIPPSWHFISCTLRKEFILF